MTRRGLPILMTVTILAIVGFQVFWLNENYRREREDLELQTNVLFRETIFRLQASKMRISGLPGGDSVKTFVRTGPIPPMKVRVGNKPDADIAAMMNSLGSKVRDSLREMKREGVVISLNKDVMVHRDSVSKFTVRAQGHPNNRIIQLLYGVDSLQEPITMEELDSSFCEALKQQNIKVPYTITEHSFENEEGTWMEEDDFSKVRIGIAKPVEYELQLGNTFGLVMKRLASPLLFSLFLVGVTIMSFVLLYRNMLKQRRLTEIKNEFISNITHELKTPIATVGVAIEALRNFNAIDDPKRSKEYLDISQNELQRLSLLVDKVLKLSMFENKEIDLRYESMDIKEVVDEVLSSMRLQIEKYKATVNVSTEGDTTLKGDRLHLLSVIYNLIDNALKYSKDAPIIDVGLRGDSKEVTVIVADNGIGIANEYHDKLFEKFFRVPTGNTHNTKGYGLGLSYAAHVVSKHNGKIAVSSKLGDGTTFTITLPKDQV